MSITPDGILACPKISSCNILNGNGNIDLQRCKERAKLFWQTVVNISIANTLSDTAVMGVPEIIGLYNVKSILTDNSI